MERASSKQRWIDAALAATVMLTTTVWSDAAWSQTKARLVGVLRRYRS
jgi:hypothetical protein